MEEEEEGGEGGRSAINGKDDGGFDGFGGATMPAGDGGEAERMPNLMQSINPNLNLTSPGSEKGDDGGRRMRRRRRLQDGEGETGEGMEGGASAIG